MGIDPGVVNVFAKYAAVKLFDELTEVHVKAVSYTHLDVYKRQALRCKAVSSTLDRI